MTCCACVELKRKMWHMQNLLLVLFATVTFATLSPRPRGKVLRIEPTNDEQIRFILNWIENNNVDVWKAVRYPKITFDIHVEDAKVSEEMLKYEQIPYNYLVDDLPKLLDDQMGMSRKQKSAFSSADFDYTNYGTYDQIVGELKRLANVYKTKASLFEVGKTHENRTQIGIRITNGDGVKKPVVFVDGGIHAREWIAPASIMYLVKQLLTNTAKDPKIADVLSKYEFHVLPVFNADGYVYTHASKDTRLWRKTRSKTGYQCFGVDPNRNWNTKFAGVGTSDDPCSYSYHGKYAFSEIEVENVATYLANVENLKSYWNVHAYGNMVLIPWSYTKELPQDYEDIKRVGDIYAKEAVKKFGTEYIVGSPANILYAVSGGSIDWTYEVLDIKYSYALELRDNGKYGFLLPPEQIIPCGEEMTSALIASVLAMK